MKINKEIVDFYTEIMNGAATESQLNLMLAMDIKELAENMKDRVTVEQKERIDKITKELMDVVLVDSVRQIFKFVEENK
jgi:hypothetical protein|nr:MAG TPA: hypothetical protein [Caudoviricetes sp.]